MLYCFAVSVNKQHYTSSMFPQLSRPPSLPHRVQITASCPRGWRTLMHPFKCAATGCFSSAQLFAPRLYTAAIGGFFSCAAVCTVVRHSSLCIWLTYNYRTKCFCVQTIRIMECTVKLKFSDKSPEKWQLLTENLKNAGCKYSRLQIIRKVFLTLVNTYENLSRLTINEINSGLSNKNFIVVVP